MAICQVCKKQINKTFRLKNARHLTGEKVCLNCYQNLENHINQSLLFSDDWDSSNMISFDFDKELDYEEFKEFMINKLNYENMTVFYKEIDMNPRTAVQTWKKKKEIPFLVQAYIQNKIDSINNIDSKIETKFVEITKFEERKLMDNNTLIFIITLLKQELYYLYSRRHNENNGGICKPNALTLVKYLKSLHAKYDINKNVELEHIHSTFLSKDDLEIFIGKKYKYGILLSFDNRIPKHIARFKYLWIQFSSSRTLLSYIKLKSII